MISLGNCPHASMRGRARKQDDSWWITSSQAGLSLGQATESGLRTAQHKGALPRWVAWGVCSKSVLGPGQRGTPPCP